MKNTVLTILAWMFIVVGLISLFLPFLQGVLFIVIGLLLLSKGSPKSREKLRQGYIACKVRFPKIAILLEKFEKKWQNVMHR